MRQAFERLWQLAAVGAVVGVAVAGREIAKQEYLAQGLMRTSLQMTGRAAMAGLLLGAAAGLVLVLLLRLWPWVAGRCSALGVLGEFLAKWVGRVPSQLFAGVFGRAAGALVLLAAVGLWGAGSVVVHRARAEALERGLNVMVVSIDTLRADRASLLSEDERERDLTPNMRELLAARGTVFSKAIAQAPWTLPSVASIFTGVYPKQHGAEHRTSVLPPGQLTIAEILREAGYRTLGVSSALYVTNASGLRQGFERFDESQARGQRNISSPRVTDKAIEFLEASSGEPFFLFVHYFDPHWAYRDHEEFGFAGWYDGWLSDISQRLKQDEFTRHLGTVRPRPRRQLLDPEELKYIRDLYEGEIAYTDAEVGRLLRYVRQAGLEKSTLTIMVADHGEEFLERGNLGHGETIWQEVVHVPMIIAGP
ncbi:MAG: sulfatase, partial [Armatimonadota bacterium]